jgi:hypothetical protein
MGRLDLGGRTRGRDVVDPRGREGEAGFEVGDPSPGNVLARLSGGEKSLTSFYERLVRKWIPREWSETHLDSAPSLELPSWRPSRSLLAGRPLTIPPHSRSTSRKYRSDP